MNRFFLSPPDWQPVMLALLTAGAVAVLIAALAGRLLRAVVHAAVGSDGHLAARHAVVRAPVRLVRLTIFLVAAAALTPPALELFGQRPRRGLHIGDVSAWALAGGLRVVIVGVVAFVLLRLVSVMVKRFETEVSTGSDLELLERIKRARTLGGLVQNVLSAVIVLVAGTMILRELGVDVTPILTSAGILGLAVGFGAQTLVKDVISGFFMILENDVRLGDNIVIGDHSGVVEEMKLRTIVLRDTEGSVHIIPNGSVAAISNRTKDYSYYTLDVPASYRTDTDDVVDLIRAAGAAVRADARFAPHILDDIEVLGVDAFTDTAVTIKARIKTVPLKQWDVGRELRRIAKKLFDEAGVELAHRPEPDRPPAPDPAAPGS
ncbi:MAG: mechanosensitive ion channel family protein [Acidobacteriota bacterium]|nr:mechanosensitive ion channel family protein [Acidobacteriota bacterium]MDQ3170980.1 mechanosensitive ion channel family protein [Acidobacteriota bacterium]